MACVVGLREEHDIMPHSYVVADADVVVEFKIAAHIEARVAADAQA